MPWHLPADLRRFKQITMGKPMIMGRRTHESIGRALPGRRNIIVTRNANFTAPKCEIVHTFDDAIACCDDEVMVIGGASIYALALPRASRLYLTLIHHDFAGDTFFPEYALEAWREVKRQRIEDDADVSFAYTFLDLERATTLNPAKPA